MIACYSICVGACLHAIVFAQVFFLALFYLRRDVRRCIFSCFSVSYPPKFLHGFSFSRDGFAFFGVNLLSFSVYAVTIEKIFRNARPA